MSREEIEKMFQDLIRKQLKEILVIPLPLHWLGSDSE